MTEKIKDNKVTKIDHYALLSKKADDALNEFHEFTIPVWDLDVKMKKLNDIIKKEAKEWARKNYKSKEDRAVGFVAAIICLTIVEIKNSELKRFELSKKTVDLFMDEKNPVEIFNTIFKELQEYNKIDLGMHLANR